MTNNLLKQKLEAVNPVDWPAPQNIKAYFTTRLGGQSNKPFDSFNLATHVSDKTEDVDSNRQFLSQQLALLKEPFWLKQNHTNRCVSVSTKKNIQALLPEADASFTTNAQQPLVVMTADCLPLLLTNKEGSWVAACHAGWRGLANGVIQNTLSNYQGQLQDIIAWIGPAISQKNFEVGQDVFDAFNFFNGGNSHAAFFECNAHQRYQFDLIGLAKKLLMDMNICVYGGEYCTYSQNDFFYSYRKNNITGRMASLIWIDSIDEDDD